MTRGALVLAALCWSGCAAEPTSSQAALDEVDLPEIHTVHDAVQEPQNNGFVKATFVIGADGSIHKCFNAQASPRVSATCGATLLRTGPGAYRLTTNRELAQRFVAITPTAQRLVSFTPTTDTFAITVSDLRGQPADCDLHVLVF